MLGQNNCVNIKYTVMTVNCSIYLHIFLRSSHFRPSLRIPFEDTYKKLWSGTWISNRNLIENVTLCIHILIHKFNFQRIIRFYIFLNLIQHVFNENSIYLNKSKFVQAITIDRSCFHYVVPKIKINWAFDLYPMYV